MTPFSPRERRVDGSSERASEHKSVTLCGVLVLVSVFAAGPALLRIPLERYDASKPQTFVRRLARPAE